MISDIKSAIEREAFVDEQLDYAQKNLTEFGNAFLDDALLGILPNDLVIIGAKSGIGKTQLATQIAGYNVSACKKSVVFIALEAEPNEIELRLRYAVEAGLYFKDQHRDRTVSVNYRNWRLGFLKQAMKKYREESIHIFLQRYHKLHTVYRGEQYGYRELERTFDECREFADLIIVDHLHFLDLDGKDTHQEISKLMKKIRNLNLHYSKPVIALAHLRKDIIGSVPALEDFLGSGDIGKVATTAIMISKEPNGYDARNQIQKTIISIPKSRTGALGNVVGCIDYSIKHQGYVNQYTLQRCLKHRDNEKFEALNNDEIPDWAKRIKLPAAPAKV